MARDEAVHRSTPYRAVLSDSPGQGPWRQRFVEVENQLYIRVLSPSPKSKLEASDVTSSG